MIAFKLKYEIGKKVLWIVGGFALLIVMVIASIGYHHEEEEQNKNDGASYSSTSLPSTVTRYKGAVQEQLKMYNMDNYLYVVLALMMQESGGRVPDVMQASESIGQAPNTITDPQYSIEVGVKYFAEQISTSKKLKVDLNTVLQSYNFGGGYMNFIASHGGKHTNALAEQFASQQASRLGWSNYGDSQYVDHVRRYFKDTGNGYSENSAGEAGTNVEISGEQMNYFDKLFPLAKAQIGKPYVLGADFSTNNPIAFDCGSYTLWLFQQIGVKTNFNRIAQNQYDNTKRVTGKDVKAGDLIFFKNTYDTGRGESITHVGIVISSKEFINAGGTHVQIANYSNGYWAQHFAGFGRVGG